MRFLMSWSRPLTFMGIALLGVALTGCDVDVEDSGELPTVDVEPGEAPDVDVEGPDIDVGTREADVTVPDVDISTEEETVTVPDIDVDLPEEDDTYPEDE